MKKTSRRTFGKQITHALAALPVATLASASFGQTKQGVRPHRNDNRTHENTPPPIEFQDGSLSVLAKATSPVHPLPEKGSNPYTYQGRVDPRPDKNMIDHIKILHGSGEWIYRDLDAAGSVLTVELKDENDGPVDILEVSTGGSGSSDYFQVVSKGSSGSGVGNGPFKASSKPGKPFFKHLLEHKGGGGNKEFRVTGIKITKNDTTTLDLHVPPISTTAFESQGYRILIWLQD